MIGITEQVMQLRCGLHKWDRYIAVCTNDGLSQASVQQMLASHTAASDAFVALEVTLFQAVLLCGAVHVWVHGLEGLLDV